MGKPTTFTVDDEGKPHSYGHDEAGVSIAQEFLQRINNDKDLSKYVSDMVFNHMQPHNAYNHKSRVKTTNGMLDKSICPDDLLLLAKADSASTGMYDKAEAEYAFMRERLDVYNERMSVPEVTGADLIKMGMKPGPKFSEILANAHKQHLSGVDKDKVIMGIDTMYNGGSMKAERKRLREEAYQFSQSQNHDSEEFN